MYLVYEVVDAECMEAKINEDDMRLFSSFKMQWIMQREEENHLLMTV